MNNPYAYIEAEILDIVEETHNIKTFSLKPKEEIGFRAGQFMDLTVPGAGEAPFTPSSNHNVRNRLDFTIMKAGRITNMLHEMKKGDVVGLRGPYGHGYPLDTFKSKEIFIVGGGVGLAPLRALLYLPQIILATLIRLSWRRPRADRSILSPVSSYYRIR